MKSLFNNSFLFFVVLFSISFISFDINKVYADDLSSGLVGHWTLNEENPINETVVTDSSIENNNGVWHGSGTGTYSSLGKIGNAGIFEKGGDLQYIEIPDSADFSFTSGFSTSFWVKPTSWNIWNIILSKNVWDTGGWMVTVYNISNDKGDLCYGKARYPSESYEHMCSVRANEALVLDTWSHVVITNNNGSALIYINGVQVASGNISLSSGDFNYNTNYPMSIGSRDNEPTDNFNGLIDDVRVYNRVLTAGEIATLNNNAVTPSFSISTGEVLPGTSLTITSSGSDHIYYTTDGNTPTVLSSEYTAPFTLDGPFPMTVKAFAVKEGLNDSVVSSVQYTEEIVLTGSGVLGDPYQIVNCRQLQKMEDNLDKYYILNNDIYCAGEGTGENDDTRYWNSYEGEGISYYGFDPIGNSDIPFSGNFDGNNKSIYNLYIERSDEDYVGLFGYVSGSALIKNLNLVNFDIRGNEDVGALVGYMNEDVLLDDISVTGVVNGYYGVGGIAGFSKGTISNSSSNIEVNAQSRYAGGIVGILSGAEEKHGIVSNSNSLGTINVNEVGGGGLVGLSQTYTDITDSYSGSVVATGWKAGGLVGVAEGNILDCYANGKASSYAYGAGGLVGYLKGGSVDRSYATGNVSAGSDSIGIDTYSSYAGGLVGLANNGTISESYATGNVTGESIRVGGLVGGTNSSIENSYATGNVSGDDRVGGLVGGLTGTIINSYSAGEVVANGSWIINEGDQAFSEDGAGGGGGYFGGEGGQSDASPGAGGSGYLHSSLVVGGVLTVGNDSGGSNRALPPNTSDENYIEGVGLGGNKTLNSGNGLVYLDYGSGNTTFYYTGNSQTFTVPSGVTSISVKIWGAGGGGSDYDYENQGGSGGYASGSINVTPGQIIVVIVGGGGGQGFRNIIGGYRGFGGGGYGTRGDASGGGGGGLSGIFNNDNGTSFELLTQSDAIIIAGGGGGGTGYSGPGGAGGGLTGNDGEGNYVSCGGSQDAGGACLDYGDDGSALKGGDGDERGIMGTSELVINYFGGLVGYSTGTVTSSFWDIQTSLKDTSEAGGVGKMTSQMKNQSTFLDWDFNNIWRIKESNYPCLLWQDVCFVIEEEPEPVHRHVSTGSSASSRYQNLLAMGKNVEAEEVSMQFLQNSNSATDSIKYHFTKNLKQGITNDEVRELQKFLNSHGFAVSTTGLGSKGFETNYFGKLTKQAVIKFQIANGLKGDGVVGPITRSKLK